MPKRNYNRKNYRLTRPKLLSFIAYIFVLFFGAIILVNVNPDANYSYHHQWAQKKGLAMQRIFVDENGEKYDLDAPLLAGDHGAANAYDYLLPGSGGQLVNTGSDSQELFSGQIKRFARGYEVLSEDIENRNVFINAVYAYLVSGKLSTLPEGSARYVVAMYGLNTDQKNQIFEYQSCLSPRGYEMEHGASVLAYQQRSDTPNICNIQRRSCFNGKLSGTFTQRSCDETIKGNLNTTAVVSKNLTIDQSSLQGDLLVQEEKREKLSAGGFIQPSENAQNADADFNLLGHVGADASPKTVSPGGALATRDETEINLPLQSKTSCLSPRGEKVRVGQFVKAYRFKNGFSDIPCQVQIRVCADGSLEGNYQHATCQPWDTSYEDFLNGYMHSEEPSPQRLIKMLETEYTPDPEYGNSLDPITIEAMKAVLNG